MRIVFASHTAQTGVFRVGSHHLSRELARRGHQVVHLSSAISLAHLTRVASPTVQDRLLLALSRGKRDSDGVFHIVPMVFLPDSKVSRSFSRAQLRLAVSIFRTKAPELFGPDILVIDQPALEPLIDVLKPLKVVYRPTDIHVDPAQRRSELAILGRASGVVATSDVVLKDVTVGADRSLPSLVLENGVDFDAFVNASEQTGDRSGFIYVGALDDRFDWASLREMAAGLPSEVFRVAGPLNDRAVLRTLPDNVSYLGPIPYADVPKLLHSAKIGLLPLSGHPTNQGRSPMKYFEYLAAGLSVVATASDTLKRRSAPDIFLYGGDSRTSALEAAQTALTGWKPSQARVDAARNVAWPARAASLERFLGSV